MFIFSDAISTLDRFSILLVQCLYLGRYSVLHSGRFSKLLMLFQFVYRFSRFLHLDLFSKLFVHLMQLLLLTVFLSFFQLKPAYIENVAQKVCSRHGLTFRHSRRLMANTEQNRIEINITWVSLPLDGCYRSFTILRITNSEGCKICEIDYTLRLTLDI